MPLASCDVWVVQARATRRRAASPVRLAAGQRARPQTPASHAAGASPALLQQHTHSSVSRCMPAPKARSRRPGQCLASSASASLGSEVCRAAGSAQASCKRCARSACTCSRCAFVGAATVAPTAPLLSSAAATWSRAGTGDRKDACKACEPGTWAPGGTTEACKACGWGFTSAAAASSKEQCVAVHECPAGQLAPPGAVSVKQCGCKPGGLPTVLPLEAAAGCSWCACGVLSPACHASCASVACA
jgi:hypothetical protein